MRGIYYAQALQKEVAGGRMWNRSNLQAIRLTKYHLGDRVRFPESHIMNWVILRPDGSEETNELGNFIDHWKPPK